MPHLHFSLEDQPLFVHQLHSDRTLVGRSDRCDLALPSETVSRVHCIIQQRGNDWWLVDRSRHGTQINNQPIERSLLNHEDILTIGAYTATFSQNPSDTPESITHTVPTSVISHEEPVAISDGGLVTHCAIASFIDGPLKGTQYPLKKARISLGGPGSDIELSGYEKPHIALFHAIRGRVMIDPKNTAIIVNGARVRALFPILIGESLQIGAHSILIGNQVVEKTSRQKKQFGKMTGETPVMQKLFTTLHKIAAHDAPVLLTGESGTGKELAALGLHTHSPRSDGPFVPLNCASLGENLCESELFGHEKGSFTGAISRQDGAFHRAHGGTLFLDELGELSPRCQGKLLRALESGEVRRVGGGKVEYTDVRVVAATNRNLAADVQQSRFRQDLFFRLAVLSIHIPRLCDRRKDIPLLAKKLLQERHPDAVLTEPAIQVLTQYSWPGNVRELRNVLTRAYVLGGANIHPENLTFHEDTFSPSLDPEKAREDLENAEIAAIRSALGQSAGNRSQAARILGVPRTTLLYRIERLNLSDTP